MEYGLTIDVRLTQAAELTIEQSYLLVVPLPYYVDRSGQVWLDRLWHRDFQRHLVYLPRLTLAAPCLPKRDQPDLVRLSPRSGLDFCPLPASDSTAKALLALPRTAAALWRAVGRAELVHSSVIGWPYPVGWLANLAAWLRARPLVLVIESAPWRLSTEASWKERVRANVYERAARWSCRRADVIVCTQPSYRDSLTAGVRGKAYVSPATWIGEDDLLEPSVVAARWQAKRERPARFLFAGRLTAPKGVLVLLEALRQLEAAGVPVEVDVIGEGPLREACVAASRALSVVRLGVLEPVPYGQPFFALLDHYHAVLVPSLSDEQPRIVFDAYARAVPVIASATDGLRPHVAPGLTGVLLPPGDVAALREALEEARHGPERLQAMGACALETARGQTHEQMHRARAAILRRHFAAGREPVLARLFRLPARVRPDAPSRGRHGLAAGR